MRSPRRVTWAPDGLSFAQVEPCDGLLGLGDLRLLAGDQVRSLTAPSMSLESRAAAPTPMETTTFWTRATCIGLE